MWCSGCELRTLPALGMKKLVHWLRSMITSMWCSGSRTAESSRNSHGIITIYGKDDEDGDTGGRWRCEQGRWLSRCVCGGALTIAEEDD
jgi:hypothetical protein